MSATQLFLARCFSLWNHGVRYALPMLGGTLLALTQTSAAWAQLKASDLIGYAVEEVGPKHEDIDKAIAAFSKRDYATCKELLEKAKRRDPQLPPTGVTMSKLFLLSNQAAAARATLEGVVREHPTDPEPYLIFAEQSVSQGRITDAELIYAKATTLVGDYTKNTKRRDSFITRTYVGLASVAERREDWATAVKYLTQWIKKDAESVPARQRLGRAQFMLANFREAYDAFVKASEINEELPQADVIIARLYEQKGDRDKAEEFMERAVRNRESNLKTKLAVGRWLMETDQYPKAKALLGEILLKNPKSLDARLFSGVVARVMKDNEAAMDHLEAAYLLAPSNFDAANQLALFLITQEDESLRNRALKYAETNAKLHNKNSEAGVALGWVYYQLGRTREAEQLLNASLKAGRLSADSSYFVAKIFYDRGRSDAAGSLLESALKSKQVFVHRNDAKDLLAKIKRGAVGGNS